METYPALVALHQDVILDCIDDPDISIRSLALQIASLLIDPGNMQSVVERLLKQLQDAHGMSTNPQFENQQRANARLRSFDPDIEDAGGNRVDGDRQVSRSIEVLPLDYRMSVIRNILEICARDAYSNVIDFHWYVTVLLALIEVSPLIAYDVTPTDTRSYDNSRDAQTITAAIGKELRDVAVRVESVRQFAVQSACLLLESGARAARDRASTTSMAWQYASWIVGEYSKDVRDVRQTLDLLLGSSLDQDVGALCANIQAIPKLLTRHLSRLPLDWSPQLQSEVMSLLDRTVNVMVGLAKHPSLEVQERAAGYLELLRVLAQGVETHDTSSAFSPPILSSALPSLFDSNELGPIAPTAQRRVPAPTGLDLNSAVNLRLADLLLVPEAEGSGSDQGTMSQYYLTPIPMELDNRLGQLVSNGEPKSYQTEDTESRRFARDALVSELPGRLGGEENPFYINLSPQKSSSTTNALDDIFGDPNNSNVDIDAIPIMNLDVGDSKVRGKETAISSRPHISRVHVAAEESIDFDENKNDTIQSRPLLDKTTRFRLSHADHQRVLLHVDTSRIKKVGLATPAISEIADKRRISEPDVEMAKALADVEQARMELQRATERVQVGPGIPMEGAIVKKRRKKKTRRISAPDQLD